MLHVTVLTLECYLLRLQDLKLFCLIIQLDCEIFFNFFFFYREAETVDPRSGHPVPQGDSSKSFARFWG